MRLLLIGLVLLVSGCKPVTEEKVISNLPPGVKNVSFRHGSDGGVTWVEYDWNKIHYAIHETYDGDGDAFEVK